MTDPTARTLAELLDQLGISVQYARPVLRGAAEDDDRRWDHFRFVVDVNRDGELVIADVIYRMGTGLVPSGHKWPKPTAEDVVASLLLDDSYYDEGDPLAPFLPLETEADLRRARDAARTIADRRPQLQALFGDTDTYERAAELAAEV